MAYVDIKIKNPSFLCDKNYNLNFTAILSS